VTAEHLGNFSLLCPAVLVYKVVWFNEQVVPIFPFMVAAFPDGSATA
jgi:hypothetical protein